MDVRRQAIGIVERADAHEAHDVAAPAVIAPERDVAFRAARDLLADAAVRRRVHDDRLAVHELHALGFDQGIEREGRAALALAPAAVAAMHEHGLAEQAIAHAAAVAAALDRVAVLFAHRSLLSFE